MGGECHRRRSESQDARERQAAVRGGVRLCAGAEHLPEDRAGSGVAGRARADRAERLHGRDVLRRQAAGRPDRRRRPGRGRRLRRVAVPAPAARAALLPDAVRREALRPHPRDRAARVSGLAAVPGAGAGGRHDRPERPEPRHRDVRDESVSRRGRDCRPERQPQRADDDAVQGRDQLPEGVLLARDAARAARGKRSSRTWTSRSATACRTPSSG